jgi:hypothetical protein
LDNTFAHSFSATRQFATEESCVGNLGVDPLGIHSELQPETPRGIDWHNFAPSAVAEKSRCAGMKWEYIFYLQSFMAGRGGGIRSLIPKWPLCRFLCGIYRQDIAASGICQNSLAYPSFPIFSPMDRIPQVFGITGITPPSKVQPQGVLTP